MLEGWTGDSRWVLFAIDQYGSLVADGIRLEAVAVGAGGRSVVVQSQPESDDARFFHTHWALWRVGLDGRATRLTRPPPGYADESPRLSADGTIYFVRSRHGRGKLFALRGRRLVGPLLSLGYRLGYYGHQDWGYTVTP